MAEALATERQDVSSDFKLMNRVESQNWADLGLGSTVIARFLPAYWRGQKDPEWPLASLAAEREHNSRLQRAISCQDPTPTRRR
jgi:hypothetical protein